MTEISVVSNNFEFGFREFYNLKGDRNCHRNVENKNDHCIQELQFWSNSIRTLFIVEEFQTFEYGWEVQIASYYLEVESARRLFPQPPLQPEIRHVTFVLPVRSIHFILDSGASDTKSRKE